MTFGAFLPDFRAEMWRFLGRSERTNAPADAGAFRMGYVGVTRPIGRHLDLLGVPGVDPDAGAHRWSSR